MAVCYICKNVSQRGQEDGQQHGGLHLIWSLLPHLAPPHYHQKTVKRGAGIVWREGHGGGDMEGCTSYHGKGCRREGHDGRWVSGGPGGGMGGTQQTGKKKDGAYQRSAAPWRLLMDHVITAPGTGITINWVSQPRLFSTAPMIAKAHRISTHSKHEAKDSR
jgi:hypothetical protein